MGLPYVVEYNSGNLFCGWNLHDIDYDEMSFNMYGQLP